MLRLGSPQPAAHESPGEAGVLLGWPNGDVVLDDAEESPRLMQDLFQRCSTDT
jgi:hypothetical protein